MLIIQTFLHQCWKKRSQKIDILKEHLTETVWGRISMDREWSWSSRELLRAPSLCVWKGEKLRTDKVIFILEFCFLELHFPHL